MLKNSVVKITSYIKKNGKYKYLEIKFCPTWIDHRPFVFILVKDITESDVLGKLKNSNDQQAKMLSSVAHEFRTPLNGIISMLNLLKPEIANDLSEGFLEPVHISATILLSLVNDLLDMSQINSGEIRLVFRDFDLQKCCL